MVHSREERLERGEKEHSCVYILSRIEIVLYGWTHYRIPEQIPDLPLNHGYLPNRDSARTALCTLADARLVRDQLPDVLRDVLDDVLAAVCSCTLSN